MAECDLPDFVNNQPTIDPLPDFPIVCNKDYPQPLAIPDVPLPPCIDGINVTGGDIAVNITTGAEGSDPSGNGSISVNVGQCEYALSGEINITIPPPGGGGGGGGGGGVGAYDQEIEGTGDCDYAEASDAAIEAAIVAAYDGAKPQNGDIINLIMGAYGLKYRCTVTLNSVEAGNGGSRVVSFTSDTVTAYAFVQNVYRQPITLKIDITAVGAYASNEDLAEAVDLAYGDFGKPPVPGDILSFVVNDFEVFTATVVLPVPSPEPTSSDSFKFPYICTYFWAEVDKSKMHKASGPWAFSDNYDGTADIIQPILVSDIVTNTEVVVSNTTGLAMDEGDEFWLKGSFNAFGNPDGWEVTKDTPSAGLIEWTGTAPNYIQSEAWYKIAEVLANTSENRKKPGFVFRAADGTILYLHQICNTKLLQGRGVVYGRMAYYPTSL